MNIHKAGMLRSATIYLQLVVRISSSGPQEVSREKVLLSENIQIKIIVDVELLFGALGSLEEGLIKKKINSTITSDQNMSL